MGLNALSFACFYFISRTKHSPFIHVYLHLFKRNNFLCSIKFEFHIFYNYPILNERFVGYLTDCLKLSAALFLMYWMRRRLEYSSELY